MARTAPVPNFPAIPGMNPGIFVLGGGGDGGGSGAGGGKGRAGKQGAGGKNGGKDAKGGGKNAPDPSKYPHCGTESHPVDFSNGRSFTHPLPIVALPGPLPLRITRSYSSAAAERDVGLGWGWTHDLGFRVEERRRAVVVWTGLGTSVSLEVTLAPGEEAIADFGYRVRREAWGYVVDPNDGRTYLFGERDADDAYLLTAIEDRNGNRISLRYDGGRLAEVQDSAGRVLRFRANAKGRIAAIECKNALQGGQWVAFESYDYDDEGHLVRATDADGHQATYAYGAEHLLTEDTDRAGLCFHFRYDADGRCVESWGDYPGRPDPCLDRDVPATLASGGYAAKGVHHCVFEYLDGGTWGHAIEERSFDGRVLRYRTDELGRPVRITRGDAATPVHTDLTYDALGRVVEITFGDEKESFVYGPEGALLEAHSAHGHVEIERDPLGRIVRERQTIGGETYEVASTYDAHDLAVGRRTSLGHDETIARDISGARLRTVLDGSIQWAHLSDALGRETARKLPRGGSIETAFDPLGRLLDRRALGPTRHLPRRPGEPSWLGPAPDGLTAQTAYHYDPGGELIAKFDRARGGTEYEHDRTGQLLRSQQEGRRREVFAHGASGDLFEGDSGPPRSYDPGGRLAQKGESAYLWDADGRLVERREPAPDGAMQVWRYTLSDAGRLARVEAPNGDAVELSYDALSRRTSKRSLVFDPATRRRKLARETRFVWDQDKLVHEITRRIDEAAAERGDPVIEVRTFCFEDGSFAPTAHREPDGRWVHYLTDPVGTPERLVDDAGVVVGELSREAFRLKEAADSAVHTPLRFPGQYEDEETGLCYNRHRYYDPDAGMYLSPDPLGLLGGYHAYRYGVDPLLWMDPFGLAFVKQYSLAEVQQSLADSQGRASPTTGQAGHPTTEHVQVPRGKLQQKSCNGKTKTGFSSATTQAQAVQAALNSPQGQAKLAELDANPNLNRVVINAPLPHPVTVSKSVDGARPERVQATQVTVVVDRLPRDQTHLQTAFGS